jgi:hypothetical protein
MKEEIHFAANSANSHKFFNPIRENSRQATYVRFR